MKRLRIADCGLRIGSHPTIRFLILASFLLSAAAALGAGNMVKNGGFEKHDGNTPEGWYIKLTDFMPKEKENAQGYKSYDYICACGENLGDVKPWCGLFCPKCGGFISGEECGGWYTQNHTRVSLDHGPHGYCVKFTLDKSTGENQGVRIFSHLMKVKRGWGYKLRFSARTKGSVARVFAEGYRHPPRAKSSHWEGPSDSALGKEEMIERCYRAQVNCGSPGDWQTFEKDVYAPERYLFDYISIKLYAYMPGEAWFDDISLVPMTPSEVKEHQAGRKPKDSRFK